MKNVDYATDNNMCYVAVIKITFVVKNLNRSVYKIKFACNNVELKYCFFF